MKSEKAEKDTSPGRAACLARNVSTKSISLDMSPHDVVYEQSTPVLTSDGLYNTVMVVSVTEGTDVICKTKGGTNHTTSKTLTGVEKKTEEPVTEKVCNITDTSAQDTQMEKANMLSMAVLGLRVLLAKTIAFNTLLSIKLFLF
ncbi:TRDC protein, partial [Aramus guarauna]|nr:TRDC protein [Aramus guarauna]